MEAALRSAGGAMPRKMRELFAMNQADGAASRAARRAPGRLPARFGWNAASIERLRARWAQGLSAGTIAGELGVSRSAVLGKIHRLRLPVPQSKQRPAREGATGGQRRRRARGISALQKALRARDAGRAHPDSEKAFGVPCSLLDLDASTCRWPVGMPGEPDFAFCGAVPHPPYPYCLAHCLIAYRPDEEASAPPAPPQATKGIARLLGRAA
jgi:GcrA cell cycle regulator